ncbi:MAG: shikimate dehydrogenase [Bacteroidales bacterium]|nr:shikimate dehydrogenase [Bacteroidales bacterium]
MYRFGLIGNPVAHSESANYFAQKWRSQSVCDRSYGLFALDGLDGLPGLIADEGLDGFNVTLPYKRTIVPMLTTLSDEARAIGAVNCVRVTPEGLVGHNTDCPALADTLGPHLQPWHTAALVLGTGGASLAAVHALRRLGVENICRVSRRGTAAGHDCIGYSEARTAATAATLIVNATPVGMTGHSPDASPWPWPDVLTERHLVCDLIYTPRPTLLLRQASERGATTLDGLAMLHRQADLSEAFWFENQRASRF